MIDLEKERELFESKFKKSHWVEYDEKRNKYFCPYVADSEANKYDLMWKVWQLSANREGYKLVPVEPTQEAIDKFPEVLYRDTYAGECSMWVDDEIIRLGYKAMIGASE